jgi:hypothetical protein
MTFNKAKFLSFCFLVYSVSAQAQKSEQATQNLFLEAYVSSIEQKITPKNAKNVYERFMLGLSAEGQNQFDFTELNFSHYKELNDFEAWLSQKMKREMTIAGVLHRQLVEGNIQKKASLAEFVVRMSPCFFGLDNIHYAKVIEPLFISDLDLVIDATVKNHNRLQKLVRAKKEIKQDECDENLRLSLQKKENSVYPVHAHAVVDLMVNAWGQKKDMPKSIVTDYATLRKEHIKEREALGPYMEYMDKAIKAGL